MKKSFLFPLALYAMSVCSVSLAQNYDPTRPPNTYQNKDNPYYWKNRPPFPGYWQQDVYYNIKASLDDETDIITGEETLIYTNNSPDTLYVAYFRLIQNAFQPGSYYDDLIRNNKSSANYGHYEAQKLGTEILSMKQDGQEVKLIPDNTILKVNLVKPILPNSNTTFQIHFKSYFDIGSVRRRMKLFYVFGNKHYDAVHWYPRISVYDRKFGWTTDQHLGREFYGDFGAYDVEITLPNQYILDATGVLQNREEVMPEVLRKLLDIKNFADKPWNSPPSQIIKPEKGKTKTWKFHAENVHDFAWTADPTYRIGEAECLPAGQAGNGIKCISLSQEPHASRWQDAAQFCADVIKTYSTDIGMYAYPKMIVADAQDGMEYPMLTLDGGESPTYRSLLAHEVGHNWFFGMIGNNETYRAFLDEGFTQFITVWSMEKLNGQYNPQPVPYGKKTFAQKYYGKFYEPTETKYTSAYFSYLKDVRDGYDTPIDIHSDYFNGALFQGGGYRQVYTKTATMLYDLQYVLGDELFLKAMQHYFDKWKICHPYEEDFRQAIIEYTHADLNWFFDQWMTTTRYIDYEISSVQRTSDGALIKFKRNGSGQMPIDFIVITQNDDTLRYIIPNTDFVKREPNTTVLPKWQGWDLLHPAYEARIKLPVALREVIIDPSYRLADIDLRDNIYPRRNFPTIRKFDSGVYPIPDWKNNRRYMRPDLWYNGYSGIQIGINNKGNYFGDTDKWDLGVWFNSGLYQQRTDFLVATGDSVMREYQHVAYRLNYSTPLRKLSRQLFFNLHSEWRDGLQNHSIGFNKTFNRQSANDAAYLKFFFEYKFMYRDNAGFLIEPDLWSEDVNTSMTIGIKERYIFKNGAGTVSLTGRTSAIASVANYNYLRFVASHTYAMKKLDFSSRIFAQYGGTSGTAVESELFLAGANPEEMFDQKLYRAYGIIPEPLYNVDDGVGAVTNHLHYGGGLNLRGYSGYRAERADGSGLPAFYGDGGASINLEMGFDRLVKFHPKIFRNLKLNTYLFYDAGVLQFMENENISFDAFRQDAGAGASLTISALKMMNAKPVTVRADFPLFLSRPPARDADYFAFRWVVGIGRAF